MTLSREGGNDAMKYGIRFVRKIKILGIYFSRDSQAHTPMDNFESKIANLERLCGLWSRRDLSLIGKITIIQKK